MLFRQRSQVREKRTSGVRTGTRAEPGWLAKPVKHTEPNMSRAYESSGFRSRRRKAGESPAMRRQSTLRQVEATKGRPGPALTDGRTSRLRGARPPIVGGRDVEERGGRLRVAAVFRSGSTVDAASIPEPENVAPADVVGTGSEVGESRPEMCRAACRVARGREAGTGGTVHWENARACTSGEIGRDGTRIRAGAGQGLVERLVGQQWQAGREARAGRVAMAQSSDCRRTPDGSNWGSRVPVRTGRKRPTRTRHDARCFWRRKRRADVEPVRSLCFNKVCQRQRQEGMAGREVLPVAWEGKPLKGKTPEALPARNRAGRVSGGVTRQEAEKACRRCTAG
jgi:hypothetical protein